MSALREADVIARYGGEEFVVAVHNADLATTAQVAEKLRQAVERQVVDIGPGLFSRFTISCGVASTESHGMDRVNLVRAADRALYAAKESGRNRLAIADRTPDAEGAQPT